MEGTQVAADHRVQLVGYGDGSRAYLAQVPVRRGADGDFHATLRTNQLRNLLGKSKATTTVAAIVMQDDPTESVTKYARYRLTANGVLQPGG